MPGCPSAACGCEKIFTDTVSGKLAVAARPGLGRALACLRAGDVLVITRLSRATRSLKHLLALAGELRGRGADLVVLTQDIDTTTPAGRLVFHVLGAVGEFQRELIAEGTRAGPAAARARGRAGGRKPKLSAAEAAACTKLPARMARGCTPSPRSPRPPACTAPPCTTTSRGRADMTDGPQDAPRHAGRVVRRVLLRADERRGQRLRVHLHRRGGGPAPGRRPRGPAAGSEPLF